MNGPPRSSSSRTPGAGNYGRRISHAAGTRLRLRLEGGDGLEVALAELFPLA